MNTSIDISDPDLGLNPAELRRRITHLTGKLKRKPQPLLEQRLINCRKRLADSFGDNIDYPKPDVRFRKDLFIGETGIPEIAASDLTAEAIASGVLNHGGLIVRGLYNSDQIEFLKSASLIERERKLKAPKSIISSYTFCRLLKVYEECGLLDSIKEYLGPEAVIVLERARVRYKDNSIAGGLGWHQDGSYFGAKCFALNCWTAITPCGVDNCGLRIIPKRNETRIGWAKEGKAPLLYTENIRSLVRDIAKQNPPIDPVFNAGDAMIFDEMTLHRTFVPEKVTKEQIVSISWFFAKSQIRGYKTPLAI